MNYFNLANNKFIQIIHLSNSLFKNKHNLSVTINAIIKRARVVIPLLDDEDLNCETNIACYISLDTLYRLLKELS